MLKAAAVIVNSASIAVNPPCTVPAEVESHLLQGRTPTVSPSAASVNARPVRWWIGGLGSSPSITSLQDLEPAARLELLLAKHLALELATQRIVR